MDPCPILEYAGGIWQYDADKMNQTQEEANHYARGIRNAVAIDWDSNTEDLYFVQHGRDQLHQFFPDLYSQKENAELPAEEFHRVEEGGHYGWPYCYYDQRKGKNVLSPEYGGDKETVGRCKKYPEPLYGFPGHWAPNDVLFYSADQFPERYRNGAFVAFHGSWNRAPLEQRGYKVAFVPFENGEPTVQEPKGHETFADGFAGLETIRSPAEAEHRPMGLAQGPDGSLYVSDSQQGRIWRIIYTGENNE
jgi:glucose/arabinose dehydrogenase